MNRTQRDVRHWYEAAFRPRSILGALAVAVFAGSVLTAINDGSAILHGQITGGLLLRLLLTYLVLYALYTFLVVLREVRGTARGPVAAQLEAYAAINADGESHLSPGYAAPPAMSTPRAAPIRAGVADREVSSDLRPVGELRFTQGPRLGECHSVPANGLILGREDDSDIILDDPLVSRHHLRLRRQGSIYSAEDLQSRNGTRLNGLPLTVATPLMHGDHIQIGENEIQFRLRTPNPLASVYQPSLPVGARSSDVLVAVPPSTRRIARLERVAGGAGEPSYLLTQPATAIGRDRDNDIVLEDHLVSRHHARITQRGGDYYLADAGSVNGSRVNQHPLAGPCRLRPGDEISIGSVRFRFMEITV